MLKIKQSPKLPAEERRQQLLTSAHQLFMKQGYRDTTTDEIARNAGVTKGALYFHYRTKEDILFELIRSTSTERQQRLKDARGSKMHPADVLKLLLSWRETDTYTDSTTYLDFWVQAMSIPRVRNYLKRMYIKGADLVGNTIDPAWAPTPKARKALGSFILALCDGLCVRMVLEKGKFNLNEEVRLVREHVVVMRSRKVESRKPGSRRKK